MLYTVGLWDVPRAIVRYSFCSSQSLALMTVGMDSPVAVHIYCSDAPSPLRASMAVYTDRADALPDVHSDRGMQILGDSLFCTFST